MNYNGLVSKLLWSQARSRALNRLKLKPDLFFIVMGCIFAASLIFVVPPFQAPDEHTHLYRSVALSEGYIYGIKYGPTQIGARLPTQYEEVVGHYRSIWFRPDLKVSTQMISDDLKEPIDEKRRKIVTFENTAQYAPIGYLPQALMLLLVRQFNPSVIEVLWAARAGTFLGWLALGWLTMRVLPFGKWAAAILLLTPISIFLAASASADGIMIGLSSLLIALIIRAWTIKGIMGRREFVYIILTSLALGLCKPPYLILSLLVFTIPRARFVSLRSQLLLSLSVVAATVCVAAAWALSARELVISVYPGSSLAGQMHYVLSQPFGAASAILGTLFINPSSDYLVMQYIGMLGWTDVRIPLWLVIGYYLFIASIVFMNPGESHHFRIVKTWHRLCSIAILVIGILAVASLLYLTYTPVGAAEIVGLLGRYFLPFSLLLLTTLYGLVKLEPRTYVRYVRLSVGFLIFGACITHICIYLRYYI